MKEFKDYTEVEKNLLLRLHEWFKLTKSHYIKNLDNSIIDTRLLKSPSLNVLFNVLTKKLLDNNIITTDMKLIPTLDLYESREFNSSLRSENKYSKVSIFADSYYSMTLGSQLKEMNIDEMLSSNHADEMIISIVPVTKEVSSVFYKKGYSHILRIYFVYYNFYKDKSDLNEEIEDIKQQLFDKEKEVEQLRAKLNGLESLKELNKIEEGL